ncbi:MAG: carbon-nitrogen hydrolase family protein [Lachnospiraceae bacterium]|nr:carbon-nitrogen hydrolase family protein [Lachnospiraceae bacterium]
MSKSEKKRETKVAVVQAASVFLDLEESIQKSVDFIHMAGKEGAKIIAFPESFLPGFPWWLDLGDPTIYGPSFFKKLYKEALVLPSKELARIGAAARKENIYVCMSATVRDGASLYLAQLWFDDQGNLIGQHRKMKPTNAERIIWGEGDGSTMQVMDTPYGRLGGLLCWENFMPAAQLVMAAQNEQIHVASWPAGSTTEEHLYHRNTFIRTNQQYAAVTGTFVMVASQIYDEKTRNYLCEDDKYKKNLIALGGGLAGVYDPMGRALTKMLNENQEGVLYAKLDLDLIADAKYYFDPAGHYAKGSVIQVLVHKEDQRAVIIDGHTVIQHLAYEDLAGKESDIVHDAQKNMESEHIYL